MPNLEDVIQTAVDEAGDIAPDTSTDLPTEEAVSEPPQEPVSEPVEAPTEPSTSEVDSPAAQADKAAQNAQKPLGTTDDEFAKKHGISAKGQFGKENRIPYSRVTKIVANAEKAVEERYKPQLAELETFRTKVTDYEGRLTKVAEFEQIMIQDPEKFLNMLSAIPAYNQIFSNLHGQPAAGAEQVDPNAMPGPDLLNDDGTKTYSEAAARAVMDWNARQVEQKIAARYAPIEKEWQAHKRLEALIPQVKAQYEEAQKWPLFKDHEADIEKALVANPQLTLERAYVQVVFPKIQDERNTMRASILQELKKAPTSTSTPSRPSRPTPSLEGPKTMEDVIMAAIEKSGIPR